MPKFHIISLDDAQRLLLKKTVCGGTASARTVTGVNILLKADTDEFGPGWVDTEIANALGVGLSTIGQTRERAVTEGVNATIVERPRLSNQSKLDGEAEARLIALRFSPASDGREHWTLRLLAARFSQAEHPPVSHELVRQVLKKAGCDLT